LFELLSYLKVVKPVQPVEFEPTLTLAGTDQIVQEGVHGKSGAEPDLKTRLERYGIVYQGIAQIADYGSLDPRQAVINMAIDDGCPSRQ